jgi:hypothetical protein
LRSSQFGLGGGLSANNRWILHILSQMSSVHLEDVVFQLSRFEGPSDSDISSALEWSEVDAILQSSTFSRLRNVELRCRLFYDSPPRRRPFPTQVINRLSRCHARGIVLG